MFCIEVMECGRAMRVLQIIALMQGIAVRGLNMTIFNVEDTTCNGEGNDFIMWKDGDNVDLGACNAVTDLSGFSSGTGVHGVAECYGPSLPIFGSSTVAYGSGMKFRLTRKNATGHCVAWSGAEYYFTPSATQRLLEGECAPMSDEDEQTVEGAAPKWYVRLTIPISMGRRPPCSVTTTSTSTTTEPPVIAGGVHKFLPFRPSDSSVAGRHECRGRNQFDNADSYYHLFGDGARIDEPVDTVEECQALCENITDCTAIEHSSFGRCEVWTQPVNAVAEVATISAYDGALFDCYIYTPALSIPHVCQDMPAEIVKMVSEGAYASCAAMLEAGGCPTENLATHPHGIYCPASCGGCTLVTTTPPQAYEIGDMTKPGEDLSAASALIPRHVFRLVFVAVVSFALSPSVFC